MESQISLNLSNRKYFIAKKVQKSSSIDNQIHPLFDDASKFFNMNSPLLINKLPFSETPTKEPNRRSYVLANLHYDHVNKVKKEIVSKELTPKHSTVDIKSFFKVNSSPVKAKASRFKNRKSQEAKPLHIENQALPYEIERLLTNQEHTMLKTEQRREEWRKIEEKIKNKVNRSEFIMNKTRKFRKESQSSLKSTIMSWTSTLRDSPSSKRSLRKSELSYRKVSDFCMVQLGKQDDEEITIKEMEVCGQKLVKSKQGFSIKRLFRKKIPEVIYGANYTF